MLQGHGIRIEKNKPVATHATGPRRSTPAHPAGVRSLNRVRTNEFSRPGAEAISIDATAVKASPGHMVETGNSAMEQHNQFIRRVQARDGQD